MNTDLFIKSLLLMGQGMVAIFLVIFVIYLIILLLGRLTGSKPEKK